MLPEQDFGIVYTSGEKEPEEFFFKCLCNSNYFDLGLGFFHSSGFQALAFGFAKFIHLNGSMRIIINDRLEQEDKDAIEKGIYADPNSLIEDKIIKSFDKLFHTLRERDQHFFNCLSWLIATKKLSIQAVIPKNSSKGIAHNKYGLFKDLQSNKIVFNGSANFSYQALKNNIETITCFKSWTNEKSMIETIVYYENLFENMWNDKYDGTTIIKLEKVQTFIRDKFTIKDKRSIIEEEEDLMAKFDIDKKVKEKYLNEIKKNILTNSLDINLPQPKIPIELRPYQFEAIQAWFNNKNVGLFAMATGTGKTITSLAATTQLINQRDKTIILITVPFLHLAEQWCDEARKFGYRPILVGESKHKWLSILSQELQLFKRDINKIISIVTVNNSLTSKDFQNLMADLWAETIFIADEAHYLGAPNLKNYLPVGTNYRLALTATPNRYYDEEGTDLLFDFFDKVVYDFPLEKAIGEYLTPYYYYPIPVEMMPDEFDEYIELTTQIEKYIHINSVEAQQKVEWLAIQRARIQNNSKSKVIWIERNIVNDEELKYTLFYAGDKIFDEIKRILGYDKLIRIHEFTSEVNRLSRKNLLEKFASGELQALIAMKCLDEGVDVPPTRAAYFLASSGNPKEFIQRRGRVLRKYSGKEFAKIYDLIAIPPIDYLEGIKPGDEKYKAVRSSFRKEYKRIKEFSKLAINNYSSLDNFFSIADKLDLIGV